MVKLLPGRSEQQKARLAEQIAKDVIALARCDEEAVSAAIEEVQQEDWLEKDYKPEILPNRQRLYKQPGYDPFK